MPKLRPKTMPKEEREVFWSRFWAALRAGGDREARKVVLEAFGDAPVWTEIYERLALGTREEGTRKRAALQRSWSS
jgi:hypothetical protein